MEQNFYYNIIFLIFASCVFIQLIYYWLVFGRLAFYRKKTTRQDKEPVSVVISAKDEYDNLKEYLPLILEQDYPDFEVVVVNDCSVDDTDYLLKTYSDKYPNLSVVNIRENVNFFKGKKFPLSVGIKSAKYDLLLLTDADCKPASKEWISEMASNFTDKTEIVLGYCAYQSQAGLLNMLIRFDALFTAIQYFSYSLIRQTYMGVGRNLAYRKSLFYKNKGFTKHYRILSGDDDLFINCAATSGNTKIEISHQSHTISKPKTSFYRWFKQKKRHLTTGQLYKLRHKLLLGTFSFTQILFYITFFTVIFYEYTIQIVLLLLLLRLASQILIIKKCMINLNEKKLLLISPLLEIFLIIFNFMTFFSNLIYKQNKWK